ncbi:hypothetical protein Poly30_10490 [Planctomycetes bacterium Poly30]|uniref:DNRLRE domain-containing protein n=1 Tax=Saltatorellus ferox TaxID=2528018 RepID=A0A518ENA4_9BACT|nr:hypothetical protein Poly30_10490 [Planctomycetes bacterium Poly30]
MPLARFPLVALLAFSPWASAQTQVTLSAVQDNTLYQNFSGALSNGMGRSFFAGRNADGLRRRALVEFDITGGVPAGSTILGVRLELECTAVPQVVTPAQQSLHRVLASWGEGVSIAGGPGGTGSGSRPDDATWRHRFFPDVEWSERGGDFDPAPLASQIIDQEGPVFFEGAGLTALVQEWLESPISNHGLMLKDDLELDQSARRYASRETSTPAWAPRLIIDFTGPEIGTLYCSPAVPNSTEAPGYLWASGSDVVADHQLRLNATSLPPESFGYLLASRTQAQVPMGMGSQGVWCLGGAVAAFRTQTQRTSSLGSLSVEPDLTAFPLAQGSVAVQAGETWNFQVWYRDANRQSTSNFTDAVTLTFQ